MERRPLPRADLEVSVLGLGTMTFGEQTVEADAFAQLDLARESGISLIDTAEMYPVPPKARTQGATEEIVGRWLADRGCRGEMILATTVTAPAHGMGHIRDGDLRLSAANLSSALEGSLRRLQLECIDLYQIHWPERPTTNFGKRDYPADSDETELTTFEETLGALAMLQRSGKIRHFGLSNETPWGVMTSLHLAERRGWPSVVSVQNPYNLLNRSFDNGLSEVAEWEGVPLLAYSPLAFGKLTGKYLGGASPAETRLTRFTRFDRYDQPGVAQALQAYAKLAKDGGLTLTQLSLAFVRQRPGIASVLLGARTVDQLREDLATAAVTLPDDVPHRLDKVHARYPNPCP